MYVSLNWLKDFVELPKGVSPEELAKTLTLKTAETEGASKGSELLEGVVIALVKELRPHPNADKLRLAKISIGENKPEILVVCGGQNLRQGMLVAYAPSGCKIKWHGEDEPVVLEKVKIRGVESDGMICASEELDLKKPVKESSEDILDLSNLKAKPGTPLVECLGLNDAVIEFDNKALTHRPDLWGIYGVAREISAIYKTKFKELKPNPKIPAKGESVKVEVENYVLCPRYCGVIIKNVKIQPSPEWMQKRLTAVDHKSYNNIVDVTNYVSSEIAQPLHAFDRRLIKGGIVVRTARKGETIKTLDGENRKLTEEMLLITDKEKALALAGVMGGEESGIKDDTTEIIIESATFNGANIRRTSTALGLRTESVQRFEKQLDPNLSLFAMLRAIELILEVSPGAYVAGPITDNHKFDEKPKIVKLSVQRVCSKIGIKISKKEIADILERLHFGVKKEKATSKTNTAAKIASPSAFLLITIPSFRAQKDINTEDDLIEEIARIYGYNEIPAILPNLPTRLPIENEERVAKHSLRKLLSLGLGLDEISTYSFYSKTDFEKCRLEEKGHILIENYLSEDQTHMRISLIPNLLSKTALNFKYFDNFKIFEIGRTYKDIGEYFPLEEKWVTGIIAAKTTAVKDPKASRLHAKDSAFYEAKGIAEEILKSFKIPFCKMTKGSPLPYAHPVKSAAILSFKGETIGTIFAIHPATLKNYDLEKTTVAAFELNLSILVKLEKKIIKFKELSKFPNIEFDISVIVDEKTCIGEIEYAIQKADKQLIQSIKLFDLYKGENIGQDKKAVAFSLTLSAQDRTLTDKEMLAVQKKIFENLKALGGIIRGI